MGFATFVVAKQKEKAAKEKEQAAKEQEVEAVEPETKPKRTRKKAVTNDVSN